MLQIADLTGLFHGRRGILFPGARWDGDQVGALTVGGDRGQQAGRHGGEPADLHHAIARGAADIEPTGPAGIPADGADHDPGDAPATLIQGGDQPRQLSGGVA